MVCTDCTDCSGANWFELVTTGPHLSARTCTNKKELQKLADLSTWKA